MIYLNFQGAFWGLFVGFVVGVTRMIVDMIFRAPSCGEADSRPWIVAKFHYMYFALFLFVVTIAVIFVVSLLTEPDDSYKVSKFMKNLYRHQIDTHDCNWVFRASSENENALLLLVNFGGL